ncbi:MAG TPA: hypothetical protein VIJ15_08770 [Dermatophilaceae bacterium]
MSFTPKAYQAVDQGCPAPLCIGHVIVASETTCWQGVSPTDASQKGRSKTETVMVSVTGEVLCTDLGSDPCKAFAETVGGQPPSMTVPLPTAPPNPGTGTATEPDSGAGSGAGATTEPQATSASPGG